MNTKKSEGKVTTLPAYRRTVSLRRVLGAAAMLFPFLLATAGLRGQSALECIANPVVTTNGDSGVGSLRQALLDACSGGTVTFDMTHVVSPITLSSPLGTSTALTISGPGADQLTISGDDNVAIFQTAIPSPGVVTLSGLSLVHGVSPQGGIYHNGNGTVKIVDSIVSNNLSTTLGGGIYNNGVGTVDISNSTLDQNSSPGTGGGILNAAPEP